MRGRGVSEGPAILEDTAEAGGHRQQPGAGRAGQAHLPARPSAPTEVDLATSLQVTARAWWWPCPLPLECPRLGSLCASFRPWGQSPAEQAEVAEAAAGLRER